MAPWRALLAPGCGPVRGSGACVRRGGVWAPLSSPSPPCPSVPFCRPALPAYPLRTRWVGLGWMVCLGGFTWCFFPAGRRWLGSLWVVGCLFGAPCRVYGVLGLLAPVHWCARSVCRVVCAASWATWLLFSGVHALCVVLRVRCPGPLGSCSPVCMPWCAAPCARCPGPLGSCSPVCTLCARCCVCGVLGHLAPVHWCARSASGVACAVSWAAWLLFTGVRALVCCVVCTVSWASWLRPTGVHAVCAVLWMRRPGPLGSCSQVCVLAVLCCLCRVLGHLAPVLRRARFVCGVVCVVSRAFWLLFSGVFVPCVFCGMCGVLAHLVRALGCARSVCCGVLRCVWCSVCAVACVVFWAIRPLFTAAHARCVVLCGRCPGPLGCCSPVRVLGVRCCARLVSWASWLPFTGVFLWCVVWCVRRPGPPGSCLPVCLCGALCGVHSVVHLVAPVHRSARSVCCVLCVVSWDSWLLFTGVLLWCVVRCVRCPGPLGSRSLMCVLGLRCFVFGVLGLLAPVHRCVCVVCCVVCAVSWATWLLFAVVLVWCVVWCARCPWPRGSCSPVCTPGVRCFVCGVLGLLAPVHRCAFLVCCAVCAVSWTTWLLFTGVRARCAVFCVWCPGPLGPCSLVCLCCV